jgi:hypothetical protein
VAEARAVARRLREHLPQGERDVVAEVETGESAD